MKDFVSLSLENHLFFARIMKEHALFLEAGFPCKNQEWIQRADWFKQQFENLLSETVKLSDKRVNSNILNSNELVTKFTIPAERRTEHLSGIQIDSNISMMEKKLCAGCGDGANNELMRRVRKINERAIWLLNGLIEFKEKILKEVGEGKLFNANYPLLIKHIIREAKLYRASIEELMNNRCPVHNEIRNSEEFWNRIMMEHALFIRGLLDPSEVKLVCTADDFAMQYQELLEMARKRDCRATEELTKRSLAETLKYRDFKAAGAEGILDCKIASLILPLLADHVLREANHYIRLMECDMKD